MALRKYWAIIPAAGVGRRMGSEKAKQYCDILGLPVLHHSLSAMCQNDFVSGVVVGISDGDIEWPQMAFSHEKLIGSYTGGRERSDTVFQGLEFLRSKPEVGEDDWVFVHDAARPCLTQNEINNMVEAAESVEDGVVLGVKLVDTLKQVDDSDAVIQTPGREKYWRAFTPQLFAIQQLYPAIRKTISDGYSITDECMAMEYSGFSPKMVQGLPTNIKITWPADLLQAQQILESQQ